MYPGIRTNMRVSVTCNRGVDNSSHLICVFNSVLDPNGTQVSECTHYRKQFYIRRSKLCIQNLDTENYWKAITRKIREKEG
jgi:hypothetical protein